MSAGEEPTVRLARLDCCAVSDALDKLGLTGVVDGLLQVSSRRRISGRVQTVKLVAWDETRPNEGAARHLGVNAVQSAAPGDVIVVEQRSGCECSSWGGLLSLGAKLKGVAGVIAEGAVRDVDEAREYDFPIFARSSTARTARGRVIESATNGPVTIGEIEVNANDFVVADATAAVFVRAADIERVLHAAEIIADREGIMAKALLSGEPLTDVMGASYEHLLRR